MAVRVLDDAPSTLPLLVKAALPAVPGVGAVPGVRKGGNRLPDLELVRTGVSLDPEHIRAYAEVCGFPGKDVLPLTYPHMLAFGPHMALMTDSAFPYPVMGLVHIENSITQHRALSPRDRYDIKVWSANLRGHAKGKAFDLLTEISVGGETVWEETSTYLKRGKGDSEAAAGLDIPVVEGPGVDWHLKGDLGRRYASVSGDHNPIHLYGATAKAFGFPRQIVHGMWSKARSIAAVENRLPEAVRVEVAFKTPILLPATVRFRSRRAQEAPEVRFSLSNPKNDAPHLVGRAHPA